MKVLFLTLRGKKLASSRIRAWNMAEYWEDADCIESRDFISSMYPVTSRYDFFVYQKLHVQKETIDLAKAIKASGRHLIWDICDPMWWWCPVRDFLALAKYCSTIVVISEGLQKNLKDELGLDSVVIPDRLPYQEKYKVHQAIKKPVILWFGHSSNRIPTLYGMGIVWNRLAINDVPCRIRIMDEYPQAGQIKANPNYEHLMEYEEYDYATEHEQIMKADIALLPPYPPPWGLMKGEIKRTVASWAGLPVHDGNDYPSLRNLLLDWKLRESEGNHNRKMAENHFEISKSIVEWKDLLHSLKRREHEPLGSYTGVDTAGIGYP